MDAKSQPLSGDLALLEGDKRGYLEQRLFAFSPLNLWLTATVIYLGMVGAYALAAALDGTVWIHRVGGAYLFDEHARVALILALVSCVALAMQRYARLRELAEARTNRLSPAMGSLSLTLDGAGLKRATVLGLLGGALLILLFRSRGAGVGDVAVGSARFVWFVAATMLLCVLFARGVELTRTASRSTRRAIDENLVVDLLHIDRLYGWGRAAARGSLTWFTVSASACLLLVSQVSPVVSAALLGACALMGLWVFLGTTHRVHLSIHAAKARELETVRSEISDLRVHPGAEPETSLKLHSLLAYEARIAAVREWPFNQTILMRVLGSTLILTLPWFGQAAAGLLVEHLGHLVR
jgi:hypothetical protein